MDLIRIDGLELRCIVGLRSYERHREQPVSLDIALGLDLSRAGRSGRIHDSADYARVADAITALLRFREYRLLEVAVEECAAMLFAFHASIQQVKIRIDKPEALAGRARSAAVEISRSRGAYGTSLVPTAFGMVTELLRTDEATIELHRLDRAGAFEDSHPRLEWVTQGADTGDAAVKGPLVFAAGARTEYGPAEAGAVTVVRCLVHPAAR